MRIDPRISWDDIEMRMEHVGKRAAYDNSIDLTDQDWPRHVEKAKSNFHNLLNMRTQRQGRVPFNMLSWRNKKAMHEKKNKPRDEVLGRLTPQQIAANTTRGATPGLIDVNAPDTAANRVALPGRRRQQRALPQVAPANVQQTQINFPQNGLPQTYTQIHGVAQPQVLPPNVPRLQPGVPQQGSLQHRSQTPDVVSPQVVQQSTRYNGSAASSSSIPQPQRPAPNTMAPSQPHQNQQMSQQFPPVNPRQTRPPPPPSRPRGTLQGRPQGLSDVPPIQQRQIRQSSPQYVDPNFLPIQAAATPTPGSRSDYRAPGVDNFVPPRQNQQLPRPPPPPPRASNQHFRATTTQHPSVQYPYPVLTDTNARRPTTKRTASSAFAGHGYTSGEVIDLDDDEYDDFEPSRLQKRARTDSRGFKPVTNEEVADYLNESDGQWNYQGLQHFLNSPYGDFGTSQPPVGRVPAASRGRVPSIKDGKRKREPDDVDSPHEGGQSQQPQHYHPQPPPRKRQQLRSLSPQINPVLPGDLDPGNVAKHLTGIGQPPTTRPSKGRPPLQSSHAASASSTSSSLSQALSRAQWSRERGLAKQPTDTGSSVVAGPHVQMGQHQGYGGGYVDPMPLVPESPRPSFQQRHPSDVVRVNRGREQPNVLGPQTQHQRVIKNTLQHQPPVRRPNSQHFLVNYSEGLFNSATNQHPQVTRTSSHEAGAGSYGVAGPDPGMKNTQGYVNQRTAPAPFPQTPSRSSTSADHPSPPAYSDPSALHPSSLAQYTPKRGFDTVQGPYSSPATVDRTTPRLNSQSTGVPHELARGTRLTSSPFQQQLQPRLGDGIRTLTGLGDHDAARLFIDEDDSGQRIEENSDERNTNDTDDEHDSATTEAFEAIDEEFFEALLRDEDQYQFSTEAIEIPDVYYAEAGFFQGDVDKWNAEAQATIDRLKADGEDTGPSTTAAASENGDGAQPSSEEVSTEEVPAEELQKDLSDAGSEVSKPSTSSEEDREVNGVPLSGTESTRVLDLPFDVSNFGDEDRDWLLQQDSSDLF